MTKPVSPSKAARGPGHVPKPAKRRRPVTMNKEMKLKQIEAGFAKTHAMMESITKLQN